MLALPSLLRARRTWHESASVASYATNAPHLAANAATDAPHPVPLHPSQLPQQECAGDLPAGGRCSKRRIRHRIDRRANQSAIPKFELRNS